MLLEIAAPPGAGKSTVLQGLEGLAADPTAGVRWLPADRACLRPRWTSPAASSTPRPVLRPPAWGALRRLLYRAPTDAELQEAMAVVAAAWDDFLRVVLVGPQARGTDPGAVPALEVMAMRWLIESITTRALLDVRARSQRAAEYPNPLPVEVLLLDDGLLHPYKVEVAVGRDDPSRRDAYLATVPVPDVLVHLDASVPLITARLARRHRERPDSLRARAISARRPDTDAFAAEAERLVGLTDDIATAMSRRGVPILRVDAGATTLEQVGAVADGIRSSIARTIR